MSDQEKIIQSEVAEPEHINESSSVHIPVKVKERLASPEENNTRIWRFQIPPQHRRPPRPDPESVSDDERFWAAAAHGSAILTVAIGIATGGFGALVMVFIPLVIFLVHREKSEYVAHHALQSFVAQAVGFVGFVVLSTTILVLWIVLLIVAAILILILVGIILLPLVAVAGLLALSATLLLPLATLVYNVIAAMQAWNGHNYSYPWLGDWVDDQLYGRIEQNL